MRTVEVRRAPPLEERRTHAAAPGPDARILSGSVRLVDEDTGRVLVVSDVLDRRPPWALDLARSLHRLRWESLPGQGQEARLSGFKNPNRVFGTTAPVPLRRRYGCSPSGFNTEFPSVTSRLAEAAQAGWASIVEHAPDEATEHLALTAPINPAWLFGGTPWTSGIINRTSALPYHRDAGNIRGTWSSMLCLRGDTSGGLLHLADLGVWLQIDDASLTSFDGQGVLHAVSPIHATGRNPHRYTVVWYAKTACLRCLSGPAEIRRAQQARTEAEEREAARRQEART